MGIFGRRKRETPGKSGSRRGELYSVDDVRSEWFTDSGEDPIADLATWKAGVQNYYEVPDGNIDGVRRAGFQLAQGLRHHLRVDTFLPVASSGQRPDLWLVETTNNVGVASVLWRSEHSFSLEDEKLMRLSLTVMGRYGYQPTFLGGNGDMNETFDDQTFHMATAACVGHGDSIASTEHFFEQFHARSSFVGNGEVFDI